MGGALTGGGGGGGGGGGHQGGKFSLVKIRAEHSMKSNDQGWVIK